MLYVIDKSRHYCVTYAVNTGNGNKLRGVSPRTNYTDHSLSAKLVPTFADRGCLVVSVTDPYCRILAFLDHPMSKGRPGERGNKSAGNYPSNIILLTPLKPNAVIIIYMNFRYLT
jgi:hypothetical protein